MDNNFVPGNLTAIVTVIDQSGSNTPEVPILNWYSNVSNRTTTLPVAQAAAVVGARYYTSATNYETVTDLNDLIISPIPFNSGVRPTADSPHNVVIYIKHESGTFNLSFNSEYKFAEVAQYSKNGTINGKEYNSIVCINVLHDPYEYEDVEEGFAQQYYVVDNLYSDKQMPVTLKFTTTTGFETDMSFTPKLGRVGQPYFGNVPVPNTISNQPGTSIRIQAFGLILESDGENAYPANDGTVETRHVVGAVECSDSATENNIEISYDSEYDGYYDIKVPDYDYTSWNDPFWAAGEIDIKIRIKAPWYNFESRTIIFEKYMNFWTTNPSVDVYNSNSSLKSYVLASATTEFRCVDSTMSNSYTYTFDHSCTKTINSAPWTVYYISFKVTGVVQNGVYYTTIKRIIPESPTSLIDPEHITQAYVHIARNSTPASQQ